MNPAPPGLASVTVSFNPDVDILRRQLCSLPAHALKVVVDNASDEPAATEVRALVAGIERCVLVESPANVGLAAALNLGAAEASRLSPGCLLLLLDQDSEPEPGAVDALLAAYLELARTTPDLGCVGPRLVDVQTGLDHGFHVPARLTWPRRRVASGPPLPIVNLNGSGTLVSSDFFRGMGGLREEFFIDHIDTDWAFRVSSAGYRLYGVPEATFLHRMGEQGLRVWLFGWRVWPHRSPRRHFYLFRNSVRLLRTSYVPLRWKAWAPVKLALTALLHLAYDPQRFAQVREMARGTLAGFRDA
jgi:rhamnosyltransferase